MDIIDLAFVIVAKFLFVAFSQFVLSKFKNLNVADPRDLYKIIMVFIN